MVATFCILLCFSFNANCQTFFSEGFEDGPIPADWSRANYTVGGNDWGQYWYEWNTGHYSMAVFPNVTNATSWLFTKPLSLEAGKFYLLSGYYKVAQGANFKLTIGTGADGPSQTQTIRTNYVRGYFNLVNDTIVCEQTGTYYIGFYNYSYNGNDCGSYIDDISLTTLNITPCTTVAAGTINSVTNICANTNFTITNSNATINTPGIRYAWQRSTDGSSWSNITNGYNYQSSIQVSQTVPTWYRFTDTCAASSASSVSNQVLVNVNSFLTCYCTPSNVYCNSALSFINVNILPTINNTTTCSPNGYGDFTSVGNANVYRNQIIYIQHKINNPNNYYPYTVGVWADLDHSGSFEENEFQLNGPFTTATSNSQFLVPVTALTGETRLRLRVRVLGNAVFSESCTGSGQAGETEDYKITIGDVVNCSGTITAGTVSGPASLCPNNNFTLTAANTTIYQGQMRYAWQRSADNVNWTNINNTSYLVNPLAIKENVSTYYRLVDTCLISGQKAASNSVLVTASNIFNCYCVPTTSTCTTFGIDSVSFNTIHNLSGCSAGGYINYTTTINTTVNNGINLPVYLKLRPVTTATKYAGVWIDFNRNGVFETEERVFTNSTTGTFISGNITIPYGVNAGEALMRVAVSNAAIPYGCVNFSAGETEDYKIILNTVNPVTNKFSYYVKKTAAGLNDGTSWINAFTSLATAFAIMQTGDTIKIAKGIYTAGSANTNSFVLKDSVIILGGFPDTGNPGLAQRNISDNATIMSGEIGAAGMADNTRLICSASNVKGFMLDGVIIEGGYCDGTTEYGPVYLNAATGTIQNTVIRNNYDEYNGSAINAINTKFTLLNSFVENNQGAGGFINPSLIALSSKSDGSVINSVIAKNKTVAIFSQSYSTLKILNSTIFKNYGFSIARDTSSLIVQNSIFYFNGNNYTADSTEFKKDYYSNISVSNTLTEVYNSSTANYFGQNPKFADTTNVAGIDNKYFNADDGLRLLSPCSPAINTGNNSFVAAVANDITGLPRIKNGIVDLGAYEVQAAIGAQTGVVYVKKNATGLNNGTSWLNAFTDLQSAFAACSDTIKVSKGVYPVSLTDQNASFRLTNHRVLMGGYPDNGTPTNANINTTLYPTQIDGRINATTKCFNVITSVNNDSTCRMIGFEIINSAPPAPFYPSSFSTMKVAYKSAPYFENIKLNSLTNQANALISISDSSKPTFRSCTVYNGFVRADDYDGSRAIVVANNSAPLFIKSYFGKDTTAGATATTDMGAQFLFTNTRGKIDSCYFYRSIQDVVQNVSSNTIIQNTEFAKNRGRSILNISSTPMIINCVFNDTANSAYNNYNGGAVANLGNTNATYLHCRFNNSYTYRDGGALTNENSTTLLKNCVFKNCTAGLDAGGFNNIAGKLTLINCIATNVTTGSNTSYPQSQFLLNTGGATAEIINSTILTNTASGKTLITSSSTSDTLRIYNSILWRSGYSSQNINLNDDILTGNNNNTLTCDIRNSILYKQQNTAFVNTTVGINPKLIDLTNVEGVDLLMYSGDDGFKPCSCSPAINAGNNSLNPETQDILGLGRVFNSIIDIGAYELQSALTTAKGYYVKENAAAGGNGLSWATAYNRLQSAVLNNCADTIRIAKGNYKPAVSNRDSTFNIYKNLVMLGGYSNTGNPTDFDRNPTLNPTILSGDIGILNDSTDNSYSVMQVHCSDSTVLVDGVIIERGTFNKISSQYPGGGGIQAIGNKLFTVKNSIIRNNYATQGGGIFTFWSNINVEKTVLTNNNAGQGGGFYIRDFYTPVNGYPWSPAVNFRNMVIASNKGGAGVLSGTAVVAGQNNTRFDDVIVYNNEGNVGGFNFSDNPYVTITNCLFAKNNSTVLNPGVALLVSNPYYTLSLNTSVFNTIFYGNTALGINPSYLNNDFNWHNSNTLQETIPYQNLTYSAVPGNQSYSGPGMISNGSVIFGNIENGAGIDNTWMTADDGLLPTPASNSINHGSNNYVQLALDILDSARIGNVTVDMGPYEATFTSVTQLCPPTASLTLISTLTSPTYQWQVDTGNGTFVNIADNANYSGTNTATLIITSIPSSWYGYKYRCLLQNGSFDKITKLQFSATWTGATSAVWEDPTNWSCGKVPDSFTDVVINSGTVIISSNVIIRTLSSNPGANITVHTGGALTILH